MQHEYICRSNVDGTVPFSGDVSVEFCVVVVPFEGVELGVPHVVDAAQGDGAGDESDLRHVQRLEQTARIT